MNQATMQSMAALTGDYEQLRAAALTPRPSSAGSSCAKRLVLGLKGTLSEVVLFTIRARLQGGALSKAARGELRIKLPVGFVYSPSGQVELDPDRQVQQTIRLFFEAFRRLGSAKGVVRHFNREGMTFPVRPIKGPDKGELTWRSLSNNLSLRILHNPRYAGAYAYGRTKIRKSPSGGISYSRRERDQWHALVKDAHPAYITWDAFEANEARLAANARRDVGGAAREGCALLQGIVLCGHCGRNFATTFQDRKRMIRLLIDDVTLKRHGYEVDVSIRFKTGAILTERFKIPSSGNHLTVIDPQIIEMIDTLSNTRTAGEIATELNRNGVSHPTLKAFTTNAVVYLIKRFNIASRHDRLRTTGYVSLEELAGVCDVQSPTIRRWCRQGWLQRERYNDQPEYLYKPDFSGLPKDIGCRYPAIVSANQGA